MGKPRLAVFKFSSCDGCQLTLLNCEDELLALAERIEIAHFLEASSARDDGPYDLSLVEGSISTPGDRARAEVIRARSKVVVAIGACAISGGIQALRNLMNLEDVAAQVYPRPEQLDVLAHSRGIADVIPVDYELRGCPVQPAQLLEVVQAFIAGRRPQVRQESVCMECKRAGASCVLVSAGVACLGPVTHAGCGALCPRCDRGCFGCFGPTGVTPSNDFRRHLLATGVGQVGVRRLYRGTHSQSHAFKQASEDLDDQDDQC